tara:strand:+ start:818 stop:1474 length:657 start_codon:yes stop_codon:yes gene_type:complete
VSDRAAPVVLVAPSGTGKTTLASRLIDGSGPYVFSVSATTREPRDDERDGIDYHFLEPKEFADRVNEGWFAEWATVHDQMYGTPRSELDAASARGEHVVMDIDVQGASQIRASVPGAKLIFVLPPSVDIMLARLIERGTEEPESIARRLESAVIELQAVPDFDYVVVNDDLDECVSKIRNIVEQQELPAFHEQDAEQMRREIVELLKGYYNMYRHDSE